ncbi:MAG: gamma-glutamyltransferase family protein [Magnetovibrionaceae bacterium]
MTKDESMLYTRRGLKGATTAPHHLAAEAGAQILKEGGNAVEAMVAMAATIAVVYPHMNSLGGDGFWLIAEPGKEPIGIDAAGPAAALATLNSYADVRVIPTRGPRAALTVPGTISGWQAALAHAAHWEGTMPLDVLLGDALCRAREGFVVTRGQAELTAAKRAELADQPGFATTYLGKGSTEVGQVFRQPELADTLEALIRDGLDSFYRGDLGQALGSGLEHLGSPLRRSDFEGQKARLIEPLKLRAYGGSLYAMTPPTQGVSALMILGLFERLGITEAESFAHIHGLVEATKQAFILRNAHLADGPWMTQDPKTWLSPDILDQLAAKIEPTRALPWPQDTKPGDTIWMGAADAEGRTVSFIQSTYWEFGSGCVPAATGVVIQNRGAGFTLAPAHPNALEPGKRPFHTLIPGLAKLADGSWLAYGNMGGEGQPQSQAAVFSRHAIFGQPLQTAITAPRWLLGRTWGEETTTLKLESRFDPALIEALATAGHDVEILEPFTSTMGHAGAVRVGPQGVFEAATDPRSDGAAVVL